MPKDYYGVAIYDNGVISYFEYHEGNGLYSIGPASRAYEDSMFYARTPKYYLTVDGKEQNNKLLSHFFNPSDGSLTSVGSITGLEKISV